MIHLFLTVFRLLYGRKMALQFKEFMADGNITGVFYFIFLIL